MDANLPTLISSLLDPRRYPGWIGQIDLVQTHISWVLLAGDFAYKIKKPVIFGTLDFSTLALRHKYCLEELRLNRRFAPDIYLEVIGIGNTPQEPCWGEGGEPFEYAVKMRRFDSDARLDRVCARGALTAKHLSALAETLVGFHGAAAVAPAESGVDGAAALCDQALDNFAELSRCTLGPDMQHHLTQLRSWTQRQFERLEPVMRARQTDAFVRECHGDLHLANLVLLDGRVQMFDCIEFDERLRWIDVANEVAFTYMDLLARGRPGLANWWLDEVLSRSGDYGAASVMRFYAVYRAMVRAKVTAQQALPGQDVAADVAPYVALSLQLATPQALSLTITHGVSGCGKTHATNGMLQADSRAPALRLRSDVQRKRLFGLEPNAHSASELEDGIYSANAHVQTYAALHETAAGLLQAGWSVVVDAAFLRRCDRDSFRDLAHEFGAEFSVLAPQASLDQIRERVRERFLMGEDASEATLAVLDRQVRELEPLTAEELAYCHAELT